MWKCEYQGWVKTMIVMKNGAQRSFFASKFNIFDQGQRCSSDWYWFWCKIALSFVWDVDEYYISFNFQRIPVTNVHPGMPILGWYWGYITPIIWPNHPNNFQIISPQTMSHQGRNFKQISIAKFEIFSPAAGYFR